MSKCHDDPELNTSTTFMKAGTNCAVVLEKLGRRDEAIALLEELKAKFGSEVRLSNNLGIIQKRRGDVEAAIRSYRDAIELDETSFYPNYNLAVVLADQAKFQEAILYFRNSLTIAEAVTEFDSHKTNILLNLSVCYESLKQLDRALDSLEKAHKLEPTNKDIHSKYMSL